MCEADTGSSVGQMATGGAIAAFMVLGLGVLGYLLYKHREQAQKLLFSFLSFEGALAFECACQFCAALIPARDAGCLQHLQRGLGFCGGRVRVPAVPARIDPLRSRLRLVSVTLARSRGVGIAFVMSCAGARVV